MSGCYLNCCWCYYKCLHQSDETFRSFAGSSFLGSKMRCCCLLPVFRRNDVWMVVLRWSRYGRSMVVDLVARLRKRNANNFRICQTRDSFCEMQMFYCVYAIILVTVHSICCFTFHTHSSLSLSGFKLR